MGDSLVIGFGYRPGGPGEEFKTTSDAIRKIGEQVTGEAVERARAAGVEVEIELVDERPTNALLSLADKHDARAIVVGTYSSRRSRARSSARCHTSCSTSQSVPC